VEVEGEEVIGEDLVGGGAGETELDLGLHRS